MKLYVLDLGKIVMVGDNPVTKGEEENPSIPIHAFLLDSPAGKILFDTGCHPEAMEGAWMKEVCENPYVPGPDGTLLNRLSQIGVAPGAISLVVASHLHLDHAGGLHLFPNAQVLVQKQELDQVMANAEAGKSSVFYQPCDLKNWKRSGARWRPVDEKELPLCPGVTVLNLGPGHAYGMLALLVELQCGNFLLVADAVYSSIHYGPPAQLAGVVQDETGYFQTIENIRAIAAQRHATVLYGHDMTQFQSLVKSTEGYYE